MALADFNLPASDPSNPNAVLYSPTRQQQMLAQAIMQQREGSDTSPIRSGWQGLARLAQGLMGGFEQGQLDRNQTNASANALAKAILASGSDSGNMDIPATPGFSSPALSQLDSTQDMAQDGHVMTGDVGTATPPEKRLSSTYGNGLPSMAGGLPVGFGSSVQRTLGFEGGYNPMDSSGGATNYGIAATKNPGVDVASLTPDAAKGIYKQKYWDGIGGDKLPQNIQALAFDTSVLMGPARAQQFLEQSGGDPQRFMALRQQFEQGLIAKNPAKYGQYQKGWANRDAQIAATLPSFAQGQPPAYGGTGGLPQGGNVRLAGPMPTPDTGSPALRVPGYEGALTRAHANDAEDVPSQTEWDAAQNAAMGRTGQTMIGGAPAPQSAAQGYGAPPAAQHAAQPKPDLGKWIAVLSDPYSSPAMQQIAAQIIQTQMTPKAPISVAKGATLIDPVTRQPIYSNADTADEPSSVREYKFYQSQLGPGQKPMPYDVWSTAKARAGATNVTTNVGAESAAQAGAVKEAQVSGEGAAKRKDEMLTAADSAPEKIARVNYLRNVLSNTQTGPLAGIEGRAGSIATSLGISPETLKSIGIDPNQATNNEIAQKLAGELVVGSIGKGGFPANNFSDADRKFIEKIFPNIASQPGTNQAISDVLIAREQYNIQKANEYGQYIDDQEKAGKSPSYEQFERKWRVRHAEDNIFAPVQEKFLRGDYGPGPGAAAPTPNPAAMKGNAMPGTASKPPSNAPAGARQAPDGHWYTPNPNKPGKFLDWGMSGG